MKVTVLYFARLRETLGRSREIVELAPQVDTLGALRLWLAARGEVWAAALGDGRRLRMALDQELAGERALLHDGAEVAFFPPVTGG